MSHRLQSPQDGQSGRGLTASYLLRMGTQSETSPDFRSVQLAEVMAQLSAAGKQIICAVEDAALADLLCRRLPIQSERQAKRVTLGPDDKGVLTKLRDEDLVPLPQHALVSAPQRLTG